MRSRLRLLPTSVPLVPIVVLVVALTGSSCSAGDDAEPPSSSVTTTDSLAADPSADAYCAVATHEHERVEAFGGATATATEAEEFYRGLLTLSDDAQSVVPAALAGDLATQRNVLLATIDVLESVDWELADGLAELLPIYEDPGYLAADAALEDFAVAVCGVGRSDADPIPSEYADYCNASLASSRRSALPDDATPAVARAYYETLVADLERLRSLASPEVAAALAVIAENFGEVYDILAAADWNLDTGFALVEEWAADPAVAGPMNDAIGQVEAFDVDVCGIAY